VRPFRGQRGGGNQDLFLVSAPSLPENPARPYPRSLARDGSIEAAHLGESSVSLSRAPPPVSTVSASLLRADTGRRGEDTRSEFASEGAPGFAVSVGDTTGPGVAEDLAS
jgi:hypothetical protein